MALLVLIFLGSAVGWLAAIIFEQDSLKLSLANIVIGAVGAVASHQIARRTVEWASISPESLLLSLVGAALPVAIVAILRRRHA